MNYACLESIQVYLVNTCLKSSFEINYACLESIQVYLVKTYLKGSFEMNYACLESIQVYLMHASKVASKLNLNTENRITYVLS